MYQPILVVSLSLALVACGEPAHRFTPDAGHRDTGQPALHAVRDEQLRELMDRMNSLMQERFMTGTELDVERRRSAQHIFNAAQSLSQTVDAILATLPSLNLSAAEQSTFLALGHKLREQTRELQEQAKQNRLDAVAGTLEQMNATCTSCHALFRKLQPRASL